MGSPRRRQSRRNPTDPAALAEQLPEDLRTWQPVPGSHHFSAHARRIAEWLNTQQPGLGYLTPQVMAAAGLTASAWFQTALARRPEVSEALSGPYVEDSPVRDTDDVAEDIPSMWVYDPAFADAPEVEPRPRGPRLIVVDVEGEGVTTAD